MGNKERVMKEKCDDELNYCQLGYKWHNCWPSTAGTAFYNCRMKERQLIIKNICTYACSFERSWTLQLSISRAIHLLSAAVRF